MYKCTIVQLARFLLSINKIRCKNPVYNSVSPCTIQPAPPLLTPFFRAKKPSDLAQSRPASRSKTAFFRNTSPKQPKNAPSAHRRPPFANAPPQKKNFFIYEKKFVSLQDDKQQPFLARRRTSCCDLIKIRIFPL